MSTSVDRLGSYDIKIHKTSKPCEFFKSVNSDLLFHCHLPTNAKRKSGDWLIDWFRMSLLYPYVYLNGAFVRTPEAMIPISDRGFCFGDGIFCAMKITDGLVELWRSHLEKFQADCAYLRIVPPNISEDVVNDLIVRNNGTSFVLSVSTLWFIHSFDSSNRRASIEGCLLRTQAFESFSINALRVWDISHLNGSFCTVWSCRFRFVSLRFFWFIEDYRWFIERRIYAKRISTAFWRTYFLRHATFHLRNTRLWLI
jgi:hypothetical protein